MIARLFVVLPFSLTISEEAKFKIFEQSSGDYKIRYYPPARCSDVSVGVPDVDSVTINGQKAIFANALQIDFIKGEFDRKEGASYDPPVDLMRELINSLLLRLRYVTNGSKVRPIDFPGSIWRLTYLNEDESELPEQKGFIRGRGGQFFSVSLTALTPEIWSDAFSFENAEIPKWTNILLDSFEALSEIGPAIAMAATTLEVFISEILSLPQITASVDPELWAWINNRHSIWQEPSFADRFDVLLKAVAGFSLKQNKDLWNLFKDLKDARNEFVHQGVAKIKNQKVDLEGAKRLVNGSKLIIDYIRENLPEKARWRNFDHKIEMQFTKKISSLF